MKIGQVQTYSKNQKQLKGTKIILDNLLKPIEAQ